MKGVKQANAGYGALLDFAIKQHLALPSAFYTLLLTATLGRPVIPFQNF